MRDLALKTLTGGFDAAFDTDGANSPDRVVPFPCELVGVVIHLSATVTLAHSADIIVNGAEISGTTVDINWPAGATSTIGYPVTTTGLAARVYLEAGDMVHMRSNGENAAGAYDATFAYIFKPLSTRPVGEVWADGDQFADIDTAASSPSKCMPYAYELTAVAFALSAECDADITVSVVQDAVDGGIDVIVPDETTRGVFFPDERVFGKAGGALHLASDGAGAAGGLTVLTYVIVPTSNEIPVGWVYCGWTGSMAFQTATNELVDFAAPCHGRARNLVTHWVSAIDVLTTFDLEVNGSKPTGTPIYSNGEDTDTHLGISVGLTNKHDVYVEQGDLITVETNGEANGAANGSTAGLWIEPMGQSALGGL